VFIGERLDLPSCNENSWVNLVNIEFDKHLREMFNQDEVEHYYKNLVTDVLVDVMITKPMFDLLISNPDTLVFCAYAFELEYIDSLMNIEYYDESILIDMIEYAGQFVEKENLINKIIDKIDNIPKLKSRFAPEPVDIV